MYTVKNQKPGAEKAFRILNGIAFYFKAAKRILQKHEKSLKKSMTMALAIFRPAGYNQRQNEQLQKGRLDARWMQRI